MIYKLGLCLILALSSCTYEDAFRKHVVAHRAGYEANVRFYDQFLKDNAQISDQDKASFRGRLTAEDGLLKASEDLLGLR